MNTLRMLLVVALLSVGGCASHCQGVRDSFSTFVEADQIKAESLELYFEAEKERVEAKGGKAPPTLLLQIESIQSWKSRIAKARQYLKEMENNK